MEYNPIENPIIIKCQGSSTLPIDRILEFQGNLKKLTAVNRTKLFNSICLKGFIAPFFVWDNQGEYQLLDGHQRLKTLLWMREKGWDIPMLPIVFVEAENEKDAREKLLAITSQFGEFETSELMDWLDDFDDEFKESIRLVDNEIEIEMSPAAETIGDDDIPEVVEPITKLGDLWELGEHRLLCGDSTNTDTVAILMDGQKADMVFADPPYGVEYQSNMRIRTDKFEVIENDDSFLDVTGIIEEFSKGWLFVWTSWKVQNKWIEIFNKFGYPSNMIIWFKKGGGIGDLKKTFLSDYEVALVWHRGAELTGKRIGSVWSIGKDGASTYVHPTQKPVELAVEAIDKTTNKNNIILDLFGGSGFTLLGAEKTERISRLMELDPHYCDVIVTRYKTWCAANNRNPVIKLNGEIWND